MEPTLPLLMRVPRAPFPLKLLPEPEGDEPLDADDPVPEGDVDPVLLALDAVGLETEPDLESSYVKCKAGQ
jgi:hypothetical protein